MPFGTGNFFGVLTMFQIELRLAITITQTSERLRHRHAGNFDVCFATQMFGQQSRGPARELVIEIARVLLHRLDQRRLKLAVGLGRLLAQLRNHLSFALRQTADNKRMGHDRGPP